MRTYSVYRVEAEEVELPELLALQRRRRINVSSSADDPAKANRCNIRSHAVDQGARPLTYLRFGGNETFWKVGHTQMSRKRVDEVNLHVPTEILLRTVVGVHGPRNCQDSNRPTTWSSAFCDAFRHKGQASSALSVPKNEVVSVWATALTVES